MRSSPRNLLLLSLAAAVLASASAQSSSGGQPPASPQPNYGKLAAVVAGLGAPPAPKPSPVKTGPGKSGPGKSGSGASRSGGSAPRIRTRTVYIPVPQAPPKAKVQVNGGSQNLDAVILNNRTYVALNAVSDALKDYGLASWAEYDAKTRSIAWTISETSRARPGTFAAGLEALWTGRIQQGRTHLEAASLEGAFQTEARELLATINQLEAEFGSRMGSIRVKWDIRPQGFEVFIDDSPVAEGTLFLLAGEGERTITFTKNGEVVHQGTIRVESGRATTILVRSV